MRRRSALQHVELDEEPDGAEHHGPAGDAARDRGDGAGPGAPGDPADPPRDAGRPRRRALVAGAAALAVLVGGAVTAQVVVDRRESARVAALADHPGTVLLTSERPRALWRTTGDDVGIGGYVRTSDDRLVGVEAAAQGPVRVRALDPRTGEQAWVVDLIDGSGRPVPDPDAEVFASSGACVDHATQEHLVVCAVNDGVRTFLDDEVLDLRPSARRVVVLDDRDGREVADLTDALGEFPVGPPPVVLGDLVVMVTDDGERVAAATADGRRAWDAPVGTPEERAEAGDGTDHGGSGWFAYAFPFGEDVAVLTPTEVRVLDRTGRTVLTEDARNAHPLLGSDALLLAPVGAGTGGTVTVVRPDGGTTVEGEIVVLMFDDGSVPGLTLTADDREGDRIVAWDARGEQMWTAPVSDDGGALLLDGRIHLDLGRELLTLDARTGAELWRSDTMDGLPVTDGRQLLGRATAARRGERSELVALDPADGSELWRSPAPDGTIQITSIARMLVAVVDVPGSTEEPVVTVLG